MQGKRHSKRQMKASAQSAGGCSMYYRSPCRNRSAATSELLITLSGCLHCSSLDRSTGSIQCWFSLCTAQDLTNIISC